jgi:hypothetical protein
MKALIIGAGIWLGGPVGYALKVLLTKLVPDSVSQRQFEKIYRAV